MRRRKYGYGYRLQHPKHVRDFFFRHSLFVRIFCLLEESLWQLIVKSSQRPDHWLRRGFNLIWPWRLRVNERQRQQHSFILGRTGSGKSNLLHHLIRHYLTANRQPAVVLFDPHGDLADFIARDQALRHSDRLVYVQFNGFGARHIHFNPFDLADTSEGVLNHAQLHFAGAVEKMIGEPFTPRQRPLIRSSLAVVLHRPGSTLVDLIRLLGEQTPPDLLRYGQERLPNPVDRQFFQQSFTSSHYRLSKLALISRLTDIARDPAVRRFTCASSSLPLGHLLDSGKVIVIRFDPRRQSSGMVRALGQLLTAAILTHVLGRPRSQRSPIHMFVDECQYFLSPTIADMMGEGRKFGLYLTLATQRTDGLDPALLDTILGNVGNLWVGNSRHLTAEKLAKETGLKSEVFRQLPNLHFLHIVGDQIQGHHYLPYLGSRYLMNKAAWREVLLEQAQRYYPLPSSDKGASQPLNTSLGPWTPDFLTPCS